MSGIQDATNVILVVVTCLLAVAGYLVTSWMKKTDKDIADSKGDIADAKKESQEVKSNYLQRFGNLERLINTQFNDLRNHMDEKFVTKELFQAVHDKDG